MPKRHDTGKRRGRKRRSAVGRFISALFGMTLAAAIIFGMIFVYRSVKTNYPVKYTELITAEAGKNSVPAPYVAAIIMAESSYRPNATSGVDARGLMQVLPETGEWIASRLGEENFSADSLYEPETAIRYGAWYLGFLWDRYNGDMRLATAAYHAGQGTVDKWLSDPALSPDGVTLDSFGSAVTETYVKRVLKYYDYYTTAYEKLKID